MAARKKIGDAQRKRWAKGEGGESLMSGPLEDNANAKADVSPLSIDEALAELDAERASSAANQPVMRDVGEGPVSRWLSVLVATIEIVSVFIYGGVLLGIRSGLYFMLALCCIWFPAAMGTPMNWDVLGRTSWGTPAGVVWVIGWGLLVHSPPRDLGVVGAGIVFN